MRKLLLSLVLSLIILLLGVNQSMSARFQLVGVPIVFKADVSAMSGNQTFDNDDGMIFVKDPGGSNRNFNPSGTFKAGTVVVLINTADATESISFDSSGINQVVGRNEAGIFAYDGTSWRVAWLGQSDLTIDANPTFAGANLDAINVGITASTEIDTDSGSLTLDSAAGTVNIDDDTDVSGHFAVGNMATPGVPYGYAEPQPTYNLVFQLQEEDTETSGWGYGQENYYQLNPSAESSRNHFGVWSSLSVYTDNAQDFTGILDGSYLQVNHAGSGTINLARAGKDIVWNNAGGSITTAIGTEGRIRNDQGSIGSATCFLANLSQKVAAGQITDGYSFKTQTDSTAGTLDDYYGFYFANPTGSGTLNNAYGVYIETPTKGGVSNYSIYSAGGNNYLGGNLGLGDITPTEGILTIDPRASTAISLSENVDADNQKAVTYTVSADTDGDNTWGIYQSVDTGTGTMGDSGGILLREAIGIQTDVTVAANESITDNDYARGVGIWNDIAVTGKQGWGVGIYNQISDLSGGNYAQAQGVYNEATTGVVVSSSSYLNAMKNWINPDGLTDGGVIYGLAQLLYGYGIDTGNATIYGIFNDVINSLYDTGDGNVTSYGYYNQTRIEAGDVAYHFYGTDGAYDLSTGGTEYGLYVDLDDTNTSGYSIYVESGSKETSIGSTTAYKPSAAQVIDAAGDAILANATMVVLNPDDDYTLTSTPTIADGSAGQILYVTCGNGEANTVTVQDQDSLASSNLQLGTATRAVSGKDVLQLIFDGTDWLEVSFSDN